MSDAPATVEYALHENYGKALKLLRSSLQKCGVRIVSETDVSHIVRAEAGVPLPACRILYLCCPFVLLQVAVIDRPAATFLPLHLVVSEHGLETHIHLATATGLDAAGVSPAARQPMARLLARVLDGLRAAGAQQVLSGNIRHPIPVEVE